MKRYVYVALAGLFIVFTTIGADAQVKACKGNGLTTAETASLLSAQNHLRAEHKLTPLKWDCKLSDYAQAWANGGQFKHRDDTPYGENMFVAATGTEPVTSATHRWGLEKAHWTNKTGACAAGKICTHYTQIVWKKTIHVGCGINRNATGKWKVLLVCNYDPEGNHPGPAY